MPGLTNDCRWVAGKTPRIRLPLPARNCTQELHMLMTCPKIFATSNGQPVSNPRIWVLSLRRTLGSHGHFQGIRWVLHADRTETASPPRKSEAHKRGPLSHGNLPTRNSLTKKGGTLSPPPNPHWQLQPPGLSGNLRHGDGCEQPR